MYRDGCLQLHNFVALLNTLQEEKKKSISCRNLLSVYSVSEMPCSVGIGIKHSFPVRQDDALDKTSQGRSSIVVSFSLTVSPLLTH